MDDEGLDYGEDEQEEEGFIQDQRDEVQRPRTSTREYRRKVREVVIKGDTPRPKGAPVPPWYANIERWETAGGITPATMATMQTPRKWDQMKRGLMDAGFGVVAIPTDFYIKPRRGHTVVSRLRKDAIEELMEEETPGRGGSSRSARS
eukprot:3663455-Amphidinium_carterae.2